ncbi:fungal Zn binuclear cluster domain-containing protein [Penicillium lagena]|uniref:fungal Zn binuclear cluster domain-containing protein n=1 Tax=Penicillium lagena TaxID=94218 RepID=UPI00253F7927|nr:fungal Zn binuclear cluster domain-containing protein [Penicillium lagena]KAJ5621129.1 fungal Zn binuclear cluster domain-containing protein [Penicillium lagena]
MPSLHAQRAWLPVALGKRTGGRTTSPEISNQHRRRIVLGALQEHGYLYRYYASTLVPRLVRKNSLARFLDQTHFLRLAWEFPPLMGAMISIAGMQLASSSHWAIQCAIESYMYTISGLQKTIAQLRNPETNDGLLATVISLSVFESCRRDAVPNTTPHVMASGTLLALRRPRGGKFTPNSHRLRPHLH